MFKDLINPALILALLYEWYWTKAMPRGLKKVLILHTTNFKQILIENVETLAELDKFLQKVVRYHSVLYSILQFLTECHSKKQLSIKILSNFVKFIDFIYEQCWFC